MQTVVLDTNALLMPFEVKINLDLAVLSVLGSARMVVPAPLLGELKRMNHNKFSKVALALANKYEIVDAVSRGDDSVIEVALRMDGYVLTNDRELRGRLRKLKVPVMYLRSGTHLVLETFK